MAAKKYIAKTVALNHRQFAALEKATARMGRELHIELSRSDVIERLCNLYLAEKTPGR